MIGSSSGKKLEARHPSRPFDAAVRTATRRFKKRKIPPVGSIFRGTSLGRFGRVIDKNIYRQSAHTCCCFTMHVLVAGMAVRRKLGVVGLILLFFFSAWARTAGAAGGAGLNIALHAQSNYAMHGWVAGGCACTSIYCRNFTG